MTDSKENNLDLLKSIHSSKNRARRARTNFNNEALSYLEEIFKTNQYPDINEREKLANIIDTTEARVQVWFQNKRSRNRKFGNNKVNSKEKKVDNYSSNDSYNSNDSTMESPEQRNNSEFQFNNISNCYTKSFNQFCYNSF